jgi:hypothetical protein
MRNRKNHPFAENPKRISSFSPGLRVASYPGGNRENVFQPRRGCGEGDRKNGRNRVAVGEVCWTMTQGSSLLATLGWETESRWDSAWLRAGCAGTAARPGWFFLDKISIGRKDKMRNRKNHPFAENPNGISSFSPGLRAASYPGGNRENVFQPRRGCGEGDRKNGRNRVAVGEVCWTMTQGSSLLATLGWETESRWDSAWPRAGCAGTTCGWGCFFLIKILSGAKSTHHGRRRT